MAKILNSCCLVTTAKRRAMIPSDQSTFSTCDILDIMNEELGIHILPNIMIAHDEYYVVDEDIQLVDCQVRYKIPYRAVGNKLREIQYVDSGGVEYEMTRVCIEDRPAYNDNYANNGYLSYYVAGDQIVLLTKQGSSGKLRMSYYLRPNEMVKNNRAGTITSICTGCCNTVFTVCPFPTHFCTTTTYDIVSSKSPSKIVSFDLTSVSVCSTAQTITISNCCLVQIDLLVGGTKTQTYCVGDYILKAEETNVAQIPTELQPILAQRTAVKMLEAIGDFEGMQIAQKELERMEKNSMTLIDNRVEGSPQKVNNRHSLLKTQIRQRSYRNRGL